MREHITKMCVRSQQLLSNNNSQDQTMSFLHHSLLAIFHFCRMISSCIIVLICPTCLSIIASYYFYIVYFLRCIIHVIHSNQDPCTSSLLTSVAFSGYATKEDQGRQVNNAFLFIHNCNCYICCSYCVIPA